MLAIIFLASPLPAISSLHRLNKRSENVSLEKSTFKHRELNTETRLSYWLSVSRMFNAELEKRRSTVLKKGIVTLQGSW